MIEGAKQMKCGACGGGEFRVYAVGESGSDRSYHIECKECKSTTVMGVSRPKITMEFGEGSHGRLCIMPGG